MEENTVNGEPLSLHKAKGGRSLPVVEPPRVLLAAIAQDYQHRLEASRPALQAVVAHWFAYCLIKNTSLDLDDYATLAAFLPVDTGLRFRATTYLFGDDLREVLLQAVGKFFDEVLTTSRAFRSLLKGFPPDAVDQRSLDEANPQPAFWAIAERFGTEAALLVQSRFLDAFLDEMIHTSTEDLMALGRSSATQVVKAEHLAAHSALTTEAELEMGNRLLPALYYHLTQDGVFLPKCIDLDRFVSTIKAPTAAYLKAVPATERRSLVRAFLAVGNFTESATAELLALALPL